MRKGLGVVAPPLEADVLSREVTVPLTGLPDWCFFLDQDDVRPEASGDERTKARSAGQAKARLDAHRVLVVDDDPDVRTMLRVQLEIEGYNVAEAADGSRAWRRIQEEQPAVVIADIQMPRRTGLELCRLARENGFNSTKFIAFTAGMASWEECKRAGFDAHFLKTDPLPRLTQTIRRFLSR